MALIFGVFARRTADVIRIERMQFPRKRFAAARPAPAVEPPAGPALTRKARSRLRSFITHDPRWPEWRDRNRTSAAELRNSQMLAIMREWGAELHQAGIGRRPSQ
jgi:hypothetical protein